MAASEPILNVPRSVAGSAALMTGIQLIRGLLPDELDLTVLLALAFIPARYSGAAAELPGGYLTAVTSFVTYMVVHAGWVHLVVNVLWMLAFGSAVARRVGDRKFLYFSVLCGVAGAFTHLAFHFGDMAPVVGASAVSVGASACTTPISPGSPSGWASRANRHRPITTWRATSRPRFIERGTRSSACTAPCLRPPNGHCGT